MQRSTFNKIRNLIYDISGISLSEDKYALVNARVAKRMRVLEIADHKNYLEYVISDDSGIELQHLMDVISTNVTSFYREADHFDYLRSALKQWTESGLRRLRIWSAASSTGEEPYTIAIEVRELIGQRPMDVKILATDISSAVIKKAIKGEYEEEKVAPISRGVRAKYFTMVKTHNGALYRAKDELKRMLSFRMFNLTHQPFPLRGPLDVIFCRNVMIYFDRDLRARLVKEFHRLLKPKGYLFVGHAESIAGMSEGFKVVKPSIYIKEK
ncbi:MAG: methyltransferase domain-containing protein [candidate division Zixibacteria bacterium]|nr:methyltransferase domain-containing protein [candidate division Zixibacteria bacterium]